MEVALVTREMLIQTSPGLTKSTTQITNPPTFTTLESPLSKSTIWLMPKSTTNCLLIGKTEPGWILEWREQNRMKYWKTQTTLIRKSTIRLICRDLRKYMIHVRLLTIGLLKPKNYKQCKSRLIYLTGISLKLKVDKIIPL